MTHRTGTGLVAQARMVKVAHGASVPCSKLTCAAWDSGQLLVKRYYMPAVLNHLQLKRKVQATILAAQHPLPLPLEWRLPSIPENLYYITAPV